jgi:zinc transport system substrate-binding protein
LLNQADIVIWLGPELEHALEKSLKNLSPQAEIPQLTQMQTLTLFAYANHDHGGVDPHLWLDPQNAKKVAKAIAILLSAKDPASKKIYQQNGQILAEKLDALDHELNKVLEPVQELPFLVYHQAQQYFNRRYGLKQIGVVNPNPDIPLKARRVYEISKIAFVKKPLCLFGEPQADQKAIAQLAEELQIRLAIIDTLGSSIQPGPQLYGQMMRNLSRAIRQCLASDEQ